jgi:hypothetical protein
VGGGGSAFAFVDCVYFKRSSSFPPLAAAAAPVAGAGDLFLPDLRGSDGDGDGGGCPDILSIL